MSIAQWQRALNFLWIRIQKMKLAILVIIFSVGFSASAERIAISKARPLIDQFNFEGREKDNVAGACEIGRKIISLYQPEIDAAVADGSLTDPRNRDDLVHMQMANLVIAKICQFPEPKSYPLPK